MINHIDLILKKIDNTLSESEEKKFDELLESDKSFSALYDRQLKLESGLRRQAPLQAPSDLLANVMQNLDFKSSLQIQTAAFPEFKTIGLYFAAVTALVCVLFFALQPSASSSSNYAAISEFFSKFGKGVNVPGSLLAYMPYSIALLAGIGLVWLDNYYRHVHRSLQAG